MTSVDPCSTSDVITFDQNWHHLYSSSAGGKDISNDTQITVIGSIEPEIRTKMLRNWIEELGAKFPSTTLGYSVVRIVCLAGAFLEIPDLEASPVEGQQWQQKDKKRRKRKGKNKEFKTPKTLKM